MVYNSQKNELVLPEYGRNFQRLVEYCKTIEDPELRQAFAEKLVVLMDQMQPTYKNTLEYQVKLWNQLMMIAHYGLDVQPPEGFHIRTHEERLNPSPLDYPDGDKRFRHYGNQVLSLIDRAIEMEDGPKKLTFINVIGSYMKMAYKTWNREHYVNDEIIIGDLKKISGGKLNIPDDMSLDFLKYSMKSTQQGPPPSKRKRRKGGSNGYSSRGKQKSRRRK